MTASIVERARSEARKYARGDDRPLGGYAMLLGVYAVTGTALTALLASRRKRIPARFAAGDIALMAVATFKASRVITRDPITSPMRAPFTQFEGPADVPAELTESVRGTGLRKAVGELLTCPFCIGQWTATTLIAGMLVAPKETRVLTTLLTVTAASDALQLGYAAAATGR